MKEDWHLVPHSYGITKRELRQHIIDSFLPSLGYGEVVAAAKFCDAYYFAVRTAGDEVRAVEVLVREDEEGRVRLRPYLEEFGARRRQCPQEVLDALTPTDNPRAQEWRASCAAWNERRRAAGKVW